MEGTINKLFEGHTLNYIDCINVDYKSTRRESFMDLQVGIQDMSMKWKHRASQFINVAP